MTLALAILMTAISAAWYAVVFYQHRGDKGWPQSLSDFQDNPLGPSFWPFICACLALILWVAALLPVSCFLVL